MFNRNNNVCEVKNSSCIVNGNRHNFGLILKS